jgi:hypothetical protein
LFVLFFKYEKDSRENLIQSEIDRHVKDIIKIRVHKKLQHRKDEIENEVKRRIDVFKRIMEKQMLIEIEKRNNDEIRKVNAKKSRKIVYRND